MVAFEDETLLVPSFAISGLAVALSTVISAILQMSKEGRERNQEPFDCKTQRMSWAFCSGRCVPGPRVQARRGVEEEGWRSAPQVLQTCPVPAGWDVSWPRESKWMVTGAAN